ncbi:MAG: DUF1700 domain-containing protein [Spirochaetaceae bacterium]
MDEKDFLHILKKNLVGLSVEDKNEIMEDHKDHFRNGRKNGKSDQDIIDSLGNPVQIGKTSSSELTLDTIDSNASNAFKTVIASISLLFFNLVFVVGPFFGVVGGFIGIWAGAVSMVISGVVTVLAVIFRPLLSLFFSDIMDFPTAFVPTIALFFAGIAVFSLGMLAVLGLIKVSKLFYKVVVKYIKSNLKIILRRS